MEKLMDSINYIVDEMNRQEEADLFQMLKDERKIEPAILIMNPKQKDIVARMKYFGIEVQVLFSQAVEENGCYMVQDEGTKRRILQALSEWR